MPDLECQSQQGLRQSVRWGERYVSSALNKKFAGIIPAGIYQGFHLRPAGPMLVEAYHGDEGRSVAIVERAGYSLTIIMEDPIAVRIPAPGEWFIVLEAFYIETQPGYQRIVARQNKEAHHVVLGKVSVPADSDLAAILPEDAISEDLREDSGIATQAQILKAVQYLSGIVEELRCNKEAVWTLDAPVEDGGTLTLPEGLKYLPGKHLLDVFWDGVGCYLGQQYEEISPSEGAESDAIRLLFAAPAGSELRVLVRPYSLQSELPGINIPADVEDRLAALEQRVGQVAAHAAYVEKTAI